LDAVSANTQVQESESVSGRKETGIGTSLLAIVPFNQILNAEYNKL
jgi:hypothetical protein